MIQHDKNKDGYLTKDEVIQLSESLLVGLVLPSVLAQTDHQFIFRNEPGDIYLAAVSKFILNAYEFGDATAPDSGHSSPAAPISADGDSATQARERSNSVATPHNTPYLSRFSYFLDRELG
jgi:hypothetical protein